MELFRSSQVHAESEPDEAAEKQGANWVKWILIAAGPMVLALVLLVVFTRPSAPNPAASSLQGDDVGSGPKPGKPDRESACEYLLPSRSQEHGR